MKKQIPLYIAVLALLTGIQSANVCAFAQQSELEDSPPQFSTWEHGDDEYYLWLFACMLQIEGDLPSIIESAETAAHLYVGEDYGLVVSGSTAFKAEANGRSGGMIQLGALWRQGHVSRRTIVLYDLREEQLEQDVATAASLRQNDNLVIAFARRPVLREAEQAGAAFDATVENHAGYDGGLYQAEDGSWVVPTDPTANLVALWVWTGEFVAACTRLGKMPTMYQSYAVPGARERAGKLQQLKFHEETPIPVEPGVVGRRFLDELREDLAQVREQETDNLRAVATLAAQAGTAGRGVYAYLHGHALLREIGCAHDPGYFTQINDNWYHQREDIQLEPGDFVFCVGYDCLFRGDDEPRRWGYFAERARKADATLAWSITSYKPEETAAILPGEIFVDQHWDFGDAVVPLPGYDIKILPTSGVVSEAVFWMVTAELHRILIARASWSDWQ